MLGMEKMLSAMIGIPPDELKTKMETLERAVLGGLGEIAETSRKVDEIHRILTADKSEGNDNGDGSDGDGNRRGKRGSGSGSSRIAGKQPALIDGRDNGNGYGSGG